MLKKLKMYVGIATLVTLALSAPGQSWVTNGLVSYYPFDGNANDAIGTNSGIVQGATLSTNRFGRPNSAYFFNGASYIDLGAPSNLAFTNNFTLSAWCLFNGGSCCNPRIISYGQDAGYELITTGTGATRQFAYNGGSTTIFGTGITFNQNTWYAVAVVVSNLNATIYVNSIALVSHPITALSFPHNLQIGTKSEAGTDDWGGLIDDVRFYNRVLSPSEISQLYTLETSPPLIGISTYSNSPVVFYPTVPGLSYGLQMTTNLSSPTWSPVTNAVPFTALGITNAPSNAFFRLN